MEEGIFSWAKVVFDFSLPLAVFLATIGGGYIIRRILFRRLLAWTKNTKTRVDDIIIAALRGPFIIWCLMFAIYFALEVSRLPENIVLIFGKILLVLGIISVTMVLSNVCVRIIKAYSARLEGTLAVTSLTQNISRIIIFGIGILIVLHSLGISIAPILATLGVGGLAVALALQDTLSNLFAGFHIIASRQIKVGDYIKLESGEEGYVADINWRTTKIRMLPNNMVLVPNDKLNKSIIINYYLPDKEITVPVNIGVHYNSDLKKVRRVTLEVAKEVMNNVPGAVAGFEPSVFYQAFGDFSVNLTAVLRAKEFTNQGLVKDQFIERLHERYLKEGIVIPYPVTAINYEQEKPKEVI